MAQNPEPTSGQAHVKQSSPVGVKVKPHSLNAPTRIALCVLCDLCGRLTLGSPTNRQFSDLFRPVQTYSDLFLCRQSPVPSLSSRPPVKLLRSLRSLL